jgi:hypothetical protein
MGTPVIGGCDRSEAFLTGGIPLQYDKSATST